MGFFRAYSPFVLWDKADDFSLTEALVTPSFFVETAASFHTGRQPVAAFASIPAEKRVTWLLDWAKEHPKEGGESWVDSPGEHGGATRDGPKGKNKKRESTKQAIEEHLPCVFGLMEPLGEQYWSLQ
jgi:hypothetical protein